MSHVDNIQDHIGSLRDKKILDIGSGRGGFLIDCARKKYDACGIELKEVNVKNAQSNAQNAGLEIDIVQAKAELLPFDDASFDFLNISEVIEHVKDPQLVLQEAFRVLRPGGSAYISVHNRYGIRDTHFHLYFLGWMPRALAEKYIGLRHKHKSYEEKQDFQRLSDMHYYTYNQFTQLVRSLGFFYYDTREKKIQKRFLGFTQFVLHTIYRYILRPWYYSTFHIMLKKP